MQRVSGYGYQKRKMMDENTSEAYKITHCIWGGRTGFKDSEEVINHIKETHTRAA